MTTRDARAVAHAYLLAHSVLTLATTGDDGVWAAAVFYASDGFDLYFLSAGHTRHARHIAANPVVAGTIQADYVRWDSIKGIQLAGTVEQLHDAGRELAIGLYCAKFPFVATSPELAPALRRVNWYRLRPHTLYFVDNSVAFGHRDTIIAPP